MHISSTFINSFHAENNCRVSSWIGANDLRSFGIWIWLILLSFSYSGITRYHLNGLAEAPILRIGAEATYRSLPLRLDLWATDFIVIDHWSAVSLPLSWQCTSSGSLKLVAGVLRIPPPNLRIHLARNPDSRKSGYPDFRNPGYPDFRKSGFSELRKSGNLKIRIFGFRKSGFPEIGTPQISEDWMSRYSDFPNFREKRKSRIR